MSEFEKVFGFNPNGNGTEDSVLNALSIIRRDNLEILKEFSSTAEMSSSPDCVLYAIYKALDKLKKIENGFILVGSFEDPNCDQAFRNKNNELLVFDNLEEAMRVNNEDCYYGIVTYLGK